MEESDKALSISRAAEQRDKIILYLRGKTSALSESDQILYERINFADDLIRTWGRAKAKQMLLKKYEGISERTAYRIINDAIHVFGSMAKAEKDYFRNTAVDKILRALSGVEKTLFKEDEDGGVIAIDDPKNVKAYTELLAELRKTIGYDKEDDIGAPDWDKIGANPIFLTLDPREVGIEMVSDPEDLKNEIMAKVYKISEDAEFSEE